MHLYAKWSGEVPGELSEQYKLQEAPFGPVAELAGVGDKAFTVGNGACHVVKGTILLEATVEAGDGYKPTQNRA